MSFAISSRRVAGAAAFAVLVTAVATGAMRAAPAAAQDQPLPRFASVRASEANMRTGPDFRYPIDWVLTLRGQPVEIIDEYQVWRRVRDWQGDVGWVHRRMLSDTRTVIFVGDDHVMRREAAADGEPIAQISRGVVAELLDCRDAWCRVDIDGPSYRYRGWVPVAALWGVAHSAASESTDAVDER